jgi:Tfp pilus assembly protein PilF
MEVSMKSSQKMLVFFICLYLATGCASQDKKNTIKKKADLHYSHGTNALMNKEYTKALQHLGKALELRNNDSKIHNNIGMTYYFKKKFTLAAKHLKKAIDLDKKNSDAKTNLGSLYLHKGQLEEAKKIYNQVLKDLVYEHQYRTYYNLALIGLKKKNYNESLELLELSIKEKEDYCPAHYQKGSIFKLKRSYHKAYKSYQQASKGVCYNNPAPIYQQAKMLILLKKHPLAKLKLRDIMTRFNNTNYAELAAVQLKKLNARNSFSHTQINHDKEIKQNNTNFQSPKF